MAAEKLCATESHAKNEHTTAIAVADMAEMNDVPNLPFLTLRFIEPNKPVTSHTPSTQARATTIAFLDAAVALGSGPIKMLA